MTAVIAIFDDPNALERAVIHLSREGFKERVFDRSIMAREIGLGVSPVHTLGAGPIPGSASLAGSLPQATDEPSIIRAFTDHLANLRLSDEQIAAYVNHFNHQGKFVIVKVDAAQAATVVNILKTANASQVNEHP